VGAAGRVDKNRSFSLRTVLWLVPLIKSTISLIKGVLIFAGFGQNCFLLKSREIPILTRK
jgi:hypothetical protein